MNSGITKYYVRVKQFDIRERCYVARTWAVTADSEDEMRAKLVRMIGHIDFEILSYDETLPYF